jgi:hydroxymethylbilane synthase
VLDLVPAAGQGTLVVEAREGDGAARDAVEALRHPPTEAALEAERAAVAALGADCRGAVGVHATGTPDALHARAWVGAEDGSRWIADELDGDDPATLGARLADRLLAVGAEELLG